MGCGFQRAQRGWIVAQMLSALCAAVPATAAQGQSLELAAGISTAYDNNLIQYSDNQLGQFESGLFPNRFSIKSRDDVTLSPALALTWDLDRGGGRRHSLRLKGEGEFNARNPTADHRAASLAWREYFRGGHRFTLRGYYLPTYYLRQLRNASTGAYERGQFSLAIGEAAWSMALHRGAHAGLDYQFERRDYSPFFGERTSGTHQGTLSLGFTELPDHGVVELSGAYRRSLADGANDPAGSASLLPDVSYKGWWAGLSGRAELARRARCRLIGDLDYKFETRSYDSNRPADRSHEGRRDLGNTIEVGLRSQFRQHWMLRGFDRYDNSRATYGGAVPLSSDPGSYRQNLVGLEIGWTGDIWRQARSADSDGEGGN